MTINCTDNFTIDLNMLGRIELDFPIVDDAMFVNLAEIDEVRECDFICHYIAYSQMSNFYGSVVTVKAEKGETQNKREKLGVDCTSRMCFNRDNLARVAKRKIFDPDFKNSDIDKSIQPFIDARDSLYTIPFYKDMEYFSNLDSYQKFKRKERETVLSKSC